MNNNNSTEIISTNSKPNFIDQIKFKLNTNSPSDRQQLIKSPISPSNNTNSKLSKRKLKKLLRSKLTESTIPIIQTVFIPPSDHVTNNNNQIQSNQIKIRTLDHLPPCTHEKFTQIINQVHDSIQNPVKPLLPKLNQSGSSGSYFCRYSVNQQSNPAQSTHLQDPNLDKIEIAGIFKPKDEEPYGAMNPKWTKWAHRVLLAPLIGGFGRSCLIPNLSYLSEAAASLLDRKLETYIVPRTEVVSISSPTFFYSWLDRRKPKLPSKPGSFQIFCQGFQDASIFFKQHPWPGVAIPDDPSNLRKKTKFFSLYRLLCGHRGEPDSDSEEEDGESACINNGPNNCRENKDWVWSHELMTDFRIEMEKLVILDYLMRNTDRGLDNFMIKVCSASGCGNPRHPRSASKMTVSQDESLNPEGTNNCYTSQAHCHVAAIDNSLAFPHRHPNGWRNYAYGWLFLPASLIGQPFSRATREHFLPLLTSRHWWAETVYEFRKLFGTDPDFNVAMFERQIAVMKGQGWNIVESLKHEEEGPLELCRRQRALVWDEPVQLSWEGQDSSHGFTVSLEDPRSMDEFEPTGKLYCRSEPDRGPYFSQSPMTIASPNRRPIIQRGWSSRTSHSQKIPRRPVGLASHHLTLDGARGLDVIEQMDALEAWHTESEIEVPRYRTHSTLHQSNATYKNQAPQHRKAKKQRSQRENQVFDKKCHEASRNQSLVTHSRSKSDGSTITINDIQTNQVQTRKNKPKFGKLEAGLGSSNRSKIPINGAGRSSQVNPNSNNDLQEETPIGHATAGPRQDPHHLDNNNLTDHEADGDDEAENDMDPNLIQIGVFEKLEFVTTQPVFKNC